jgi:hypothetical protein
MSCVLNCEVERSRPGLILHRRITAGVEKTLNRGCAPRPHSAVQGGCAVLVLQMNIGAFVDQALDSFHLPFRTPRRTRDETIRCVMQRATSAMISHRVWIRAGSQQQSNNLHTVTGGCQMQSGIPIIKPMKDF